MPCITLTFKKSDTTGHAYWLVKGLGTRVKQDFHTENAEIEGVHKLMLRAGWTVVDVESFKHLYRSSLPNGDVCYMLPNTEHMKELLARFGGAK